MVIIKKRPRLKILVAFLNSRKEKKMAETKKKVKLSIEETKNLFDAYN